MISEELPGEWSRRSMDHAQPRLTDITFVAFDTETTGLLPLMHRLLEVGAIRFRLNGHELATFQQLIDPQIPIPKWPSINNSYNFGKCPIMLLWKRPLWKRSFAKNLSP
jgi:Exonuclease